MTDRFQLTARSEKWIDGIRVDHQTGKPIALASRTTAVM